MDLFQKWLKIELTLLAPGVTPRKSIRICIYNLKNNTQLKLKLKEQQNQLGFSLSKKEINWGFYEGFEEENNRNCIYLGTNF
jgi:hypothetical protein